VDNASSCSFDSCVVFKLKMGGLIKIGRQKLTFEVLLPEISFCDLLLILKDTPTAKVITDYKRKKVGNSPLSSMP